MSIAARPAMAHHFTADEDGQKMRIYLTKACRTCPLKDQCTTANERRIKRWEHEHVVEAAQARLDQNPQAMRVRRETVEHPFATLKMRKGATHFLMKRLPNVATEMALNVLSYNLTRVLNIVGVKPLLAAMRAGGAGSGLNGDTDGRPTLHGGARRLTRDAEHQKYSEIAALVSVTVGREQFRNAEPRFYTAWTRTGPRRRCASVNARLQSCSNASNSGQTFLKVDAYKSNP